MQRTRVICDSCPVETGPVGEGPIPQVLSDAEIDGDPMGEELDPMDEEEEKDDRDLASVGALAAPELIDGDGWFDATRSPLRTGRRGGYGPIAPPQRDRISLHARKSV
jgi:hypothetical protein